MGKKFAIKLIGCPDVPDIKITIIQLHKIYK